MIFIGHSFKQFELLKLTNCKKKIQFHFFLNINGAHQLLKNLQIKNDGWKITTKKNILLSE